MYICTIYCTPTALYGSCWKSRGWQIVEEWKRFKLIVYLYVCLIRGGKKQKKKRWKTYLVENINLFLCSYYKYFFLNYNKKKPIQVKRNLNARKHNTITHNGRGEGSRWVIFYLTSSPLNMWGQNFREFGRKLSTPSKSYPIYEGKFLVGWGRKL